MTEQDVSKFITIIFLVLGILFFFSSAGLGTFFLILSAISSAFWLFGQRLEKIEKDIEMINNLSIKNDERLHNI